MQRMPRSSTRPRVKDALRWQQYSSSRPTLPSVSRKATKSSPSNRTRRGSQSGCGNSSESSAGNQKRRMAVPIVVPGPTRHIVSLSSFDSIGTSPGRLSFSLPWKIVESQSFQPSPLPWKAIANRRRGRYDLARKNEWRGAPTMMSREDNELMCRVGRDTLMGKTLRRYWHPLCQSTELPRPDCAPVRARLLGEKLVAFRDSTGKVGLLDEFCLHRGVSLALGRVEEGGIRCLYHGWKFTADGSLVDTPNHGDPRLCKALKANSYPAIEEGGIIWAYLGPKDRQPPFRRFPFMGAPPENRTIIRINVHANYVQMWEGGADSSHVGILHSNAARPGWMDRTFIANPDPLNPAAFPVEDNAPALEAQET